MPVSEFPNLTEPATGDEESKALAYAATHAGPREMQLSHTNWIG